MTQDALTHLTTQMLPALEREMHTVLKADNGVPDVFHGMLHYHMGWVDAELQPAAVNAGKRIRPILCLLACQAAGGAWRQAVPAAAAVEILHNFSLVHDDIEDVSPTRRGRPTVWKVWGIEQAINSGDTMFAMAHLALNRLVDQGVEPAVVVQALRRFDETCVALTYGQHLDMDFERRDQVSVDTYLEMITGKTAVLVSLAAELGALIAGASAAAVSHYAEFGLHLGLAFQIIDDILGIWGDEARTGKSAATDILTKKKTLPVLDGLAKSAELQQLYATAEADELFVQTVIGILDAVGAHQFAVDQAASHSSQALAHLHAASPAGPAAQALHQLTDLLLRRDF